MAGLEEVNDVRAWVTRCQVYLPSILDVFRVQVEYKDFRVFKSFGSEAELRTFLDGVAMACEALGQVFIRPRVPGEASIRYDRAVDKPGVQVPEDDIPF